MKIKIGLGSALLSTGILLFTAALPTLAQGQTLEEAELPPLTNVVTTDSTGTAALPDDGLMDFIFPSSVGGTPVRSISADAFRGCTLFRTVTLPSTVTELGDNAFADCPYLESIILLGRADTFDMVLGANWSGRANVLYEFVVVPDVPTDEPSDGNDVPAETPAETPEDPSEPSELPVEPDGLSGPTTEPEAPAEPPAEPEEITSSSESSDPAVPVVIEPPAEPSGEGSGTSSPLPESETRPEALNT